MCPPSLCVYPLVLGVSPYAVIECHCLKCAKGFGGKGFSIMPGGEFFQPLSVYIYRQKGLQLILQRPMSPWKRWEHTYVKEDVQSKGDALRKEREGHTQGFLEQIFFFFQQS